MKATVEAHTARLEELHGDTLRKEREAEATLQVALAEVPPQEAVERQLWVAIQLQPEQFGTLLKHMTLAAEISRHKAERDAHLAEEERRVLCTQLEVLCGEVNDSQTLLEDWFDFIAQMEDEYEEQLNQKDREIERLEKLFDKEQRRSEKLEDRMEKASERQATIVEKLQTQLKASGELYQHTLREDSVLAIEFMQAEKHAYAKLQRNEAHIAHLEYELARAQHGHVPSLLEELPGYEQLITMHQDKCDEFDESQAQLQLSEEHVALLKGEVAEHEETIGALEAELEATRASLTDELIEVRRQGLEDLAAQTDAAKADVAQLAAVIEKRTAVLTDRINKLEGDLGDSALREADMRKQLRETTQKLADAEERAMAEASRLTKEARDTHATIVKTFKSDVAAVETRLHEVATTSSARIAELEKEVKRLEQELAIARRAASSSTAELQAELAAERERREAMRIEYECVMGAYKSALRDAERQGEVQRREIEAYFEDQLEEIPVGGAVLAPELEILERISEQLLRRAETAEDQAEKESTGRTRAEIALENALEELSE
eukprot:6335670-Prymnesium_polylepis.1